MSCVSIAEIAEAAPAALLPRAGENHRICCLVTSSTWKVKEEATFMRIPDEKKDKSACEKKAKGENAP